MKAIFKYYGPAILWALFVLIMCSIKLGSLMHSSLFFPGFDKLVHCGFFFMMVVFLCYGSIKEQSAITLSYTAVIAISILAMVYGGVIEILQLVLFTWRTAEWDDLFADAVGALMAAAGIMLTFNAQRYVKS